METDYLNLKNMGLKEKLLKNVKKSTLEFKNSLDILEKLQKSKKLIENYYNLLNDTFLKESNFIKKKLNNLFKKREKINYNVKINLKIFKENFKIFSNLMIDNFFLIFVQNFNKEKQKKMEDENIFQKKKIYKFSHFSSINKSKSNNSGFFLEKKKENKSSSFKKTKKKYLRNLKQLQNNKSNLFFFTKKKLEDKKHLKFISKMKKEFDSIHQSSINTKDIEKRLFNMPPSLNLKSPYVSIRKLRRTIQYKDTKRSSKSSLKLIDGSEILLRNLGNVRDSIIENNQIDNFIPDN